MLRNERKILLKKKQMLHFNKKSNKYIFEFCTLKVQQKRLVDCLIYRYCVFTERHWLVSFYTK